MGFRAVPTMTLAILMGAMAAAGDAPFFEKTVVLARGERPGAYAIPKIVVTPKDTAIIVGQDRRGGDWGRRIAPFCLRSTDGGKTWSIPASLLPEDFPNQADYLLKPTGIVVDRKTGRVFVFISRSPLRSPGGKLIDEIWFYTHIQETRRYGRDWFLVHSDDEGASWSPPQEVTEQLIVKPYWQEWSPVHTGIQLQFGAHQGRLLVPVRCYCPEQDPSEHDTKYQTNAVIYSDDGGKTWTPGGKSDPHLGECSVAEGSDGAIYINQRVSKGREGERWYAVSHDGGDSFAPSCGTGLEDARCHAGLLRYAAPEGNVFLLSNVPGPKRTGLSISVSRDEGETWERRRVVHAGHTAYSDLAVLADRTVLCVYETGEKTSRKDLAVARFNWAWLEP